MLVLTRKPEEKIFIGKNREICITVVKIDGGKVRLGIEAPKDVTIDREEVAKRKENLEKELIQAAI